MQLRRQRSRQYTRCLVGAGVALTLLLTAASAGAQRRKKIVLSEFVIEGRVQKPQAFILLQRENLNFEGLELKKSFVPRIVKAAEREPF